MPSPEIIDRIRRSTHKDTPTLARELGLSRNYVYTLRAALGCRAVPLRRTIPERIAAALDTDGLLTILVTVKFYGPFMASRILSAATDSLISPQALDYYIHRHSGRYPNLQASFNIIEALRPWYPPTKKHPNSTSTRP